MLMPGGAEKVSFVCVVARTVALVNGSENPPGTFGVFLIKVESVEIGSSGGGVPELDGMPIFGSAFVGKSILSIDVKWGVSTAASVSFL